MPGYVPIAPDRRRRSKRPPVHRVGNLMRQCPCGLWHEQSTTAQVVRVVCSCRRVVWEARPKPSYDNAPLVVL